MVEEYLLIITIITYYYLLLLIITYYYLLLLIITYYYLLLLIITYYYLLLLIITIITIITVILYILIYCIYIYIVYIHYICLLFLVITLSVFGVMNFHLAVKTWVFHYPAIGPWDSRLLGGAVEVRNGHNYGVINPIIWDIARISHITIVIVSPCNWNFQGVYHESTFFFGPFNS